ncbi:MAG: cytochrome P460 family protein [Gammaproteobacteria bacterium]|nr:cytochrome P460 family protein [Gammaproteobacteria bacterium]
MSITSIRVEHLLRIVAAMGVAAVSSGVVPVAAQSRLDIAVYQDEQLVYPADAARWIVMGANLGGDYNELVFDANNPGSIGIVQMEPAAYDYLQANGRYADGTMLLLTRYVSTRKSEPQLQGFVQDNLLFKEIHVIDRERFAEGRAFFVYADPAVDRVAAVPPGSECVQCHEAHGAFNGTFTQFYPTSPAHALHD